MLCHVMSLNFICVPLLTVNDSIRKIFTYNRWESTRFLRMSHGFDSVTEIFAKRKESFLNKIRFNLRHIRGGSPTIRRGTFRRRLLFAAVFKYHDGVRVGLGLCSGIKKKKERGPHAERGVF